MMTMLILILLLVFVLQFSCRRVLYLSDKYNTVQIYRLIDTNGDINDDKDEKINITIGLCLASACLKCHV